MLSRVSKTASAGESSARRTWGIGKPARALFLHAAERLDADPARCIVVEDMRELPDLLPAA